MLRVIAIFLLQAMVVGAVCRAEYLEGTGSSPDLLLLIQRIPPGAITAVERIPVSTPFFGGANLFLVTKFFEQSGVPFPKGAFALYDVQSSIVIVQNTFKNLDLASICLGTDCRMGPFLDAIVEVTTYECTSNLFDANFPADPPSFADLAELPNDAIRVLDQVTFVAKSGRDVSLHRTSTSHSVKDAKSTPLEKRRNFEKAEFGTIVSGECTINPNPEIHDGWISYKFRMQTPDNKVPEYSFENSFICLINRPLIIYTARIPDSGGKILVVTATARLVSYLYDGSYLETTPVNSDTR